MSQIRIDEITESKTGKSWRIKSGNQWYGANKDEFGLQCKGQTYDAQVTTGDFGPWITLAKPAKQAPSPSREAPRADSGDMRYLPFASNTVAHAISAGLIKEPTQIKAWFIAAKQAVEGADSGDVSF